MTVAKAVTAAFAAVLAAIIPAFTVGPLGWAEWANVIILAAGAIQVYNTANIPGWNAAKLVASAISAGAVVFVSAFSGGVSVAEWMQVAVAVLGALGVYGVPNGGRHARADGL